MPFLQRLFASLPTLTFSRAIISLAYLPLLAAFLCAGSAYGSVACNNNSGDATLVQNAINATASGGTLTITGNCSMGGSQLNAGGLTITGTATLNGNGSTYILNIGANTTVSGLTFDGAGIIIQSGASSSTIISGVTITQNTMRNITNNLYMTCVSTGGILRNTSITNNICTNVWTGGYVNTTSNPADPVSPVGMSFFGGLDNTNISGNTFSFIENDAIHIGFNGMIGNTGPFTGHNNKISNNTFTKVHRIPLEVQTAWGYPNSCPGGCQSSTDASQGMEISGNYVHDMAWPYWNSYAYSLVPAWTTNGKYINNTAILDSTQTPAFCCGTAPYIPIAYEIATNNLLMQGNVAAQSSTITPKFSSFVNIGFGAGTDTFQNNIICGPMGGGGNVGYESPIPHPAILDQYEYRNLSSCPAGSNLSASNIVLAFTSANNQSFPSGGNGTWTNSVISTLSIRQVQYFLDGSSNPAATQQIQDVNTNFANDRKWLYHATISTTGLAGGNHTITATATDVSGASQSVTQNFTVGSGGGGSVPTISSFTATPAIISPGGRSTLAWSTSGATTLSINQGVGTVTGTTSASVTPTLTTTYLLTATNSAGSASQSVTVTVGAAGTPLISSFTANPGTISAGGVSTLSWVTSGATTLTISPGIGDVTGNTGQTLRTVSPEPGLLFGRIPGGSPLTLSQFGDYNSAMGSSPDGGPPLPFLKMIDVLMTSWTGTGADHANSGDFIPSGSVSPYFIKVNGGQTAIIRGNTNYFCYNLASPALQSYFFDTFFPTVYLNHHGPNFLNGVPVDAAHPTFVTMDGFSTDYGYCVAPDGSTPTWDAGYDQTRAQWYIDEDKYFAYAVAHAPEIRLVPHIGSMEDDSYATFAALYKHIPAIEKEPYTIYTLNTVGFQQLYAQFINLARFANDPVAFPPLFTQGGEPATRRIFWGVWLASGDNSLANIENAFAQYAMIRGPSTYWDVVHSDVGQSPIDPALWLPTAQWIGNGTDLPTSVPGTGTAQNSVLVRHFGNSQTGKGGIAFVNMTGSTQTVAVPVGATDFSGQNAVGTSISIPSNRGRVLRLPSGGIIGGGGGSGSGSIGVSPAVTTTYVLNACNSAGCTQASTTVTVTPGGGGGGTCGTHPYWRVYGTLSSNGDNDTANPLSSSELQFHGTPGGSQIAVGGTALASTTFGGYPASNAFDGNTATFWSAASGANVPQWLGYHFATPVNVSEFTWRDRGDSYPPWQDPRAGTLDYSDDGTAWTSVGSFTFPSWSNGESKTFTLNGGGGACVPVINSFTANPTTITLGASSTLAWNVTGATALAIDQGVGTVTGLNSISVSPTVDTTYTLTASTSTGNATQTVTVHVLIGGGGATPLITSFTATPATIAPGASSQLAWTVTGANTISIDQGVGIVTNLSSTLVSPAITTTYVLSATNARGTVSASVTVTVNGGGAPPAILSFIATPPLILTGGASTLSWITNGGETSLSIDNGIGSVLGTTSFVVHPAITTVYTLTATNASGSVTKVATVTIVAACAM